MYLVAFFLFFFFKYSAKSSLSSSFSPQRLSKEMGAGALRGERAGEGTGEGGEVGAGRLSRTGRAQYKPQPRRLLAMMMSVTASNTTWMFPVSVAQVM